MFVAFQGVLDANGRGVPRIALPKIPALSGVRFYLAAVVIDSAAPQSIAAISQQFGVTIQ